MKKYKIIPMEYVTKDNYRWIYIHLVSRCFGSNLKCITMVPFCQFFNHHTSDVFYDFAYEPENPFKDQACVYPDPKDFATEEQRAAVDSSDDSYDSKDYDAEGEYDYTNIDVRMIKWCSKESDTLKDK